MTETTQRKSSRKWFVLGALTSLAFLGTAYLLEHLEKLNPCPLCLLQRYALWILALIFILGALFIGPRLWRRGLTLGILLIGSLGILLSGRQIWLQQLPMDQMPPCTAGLERLLSYHSVPEALMMAFTASGECGVVDYRILGFSLAVWSFLIFIGFVLFGCFIWVRD